MMKQKITKVNWTILLFSFLLEIGLINIMLVTKLDISIYNEIYNLKKVNAVCIGVDFIFIFYMLDFAINWKKSKDILKTGKADVNFKIVKNFFIVEMVKMILVIISLQVTIDSRKSSYTAIYIVFLIVIFSYYILYMLLPKKENLSRKIKKLQKRNKDLKFILIEGNILPSSFDIEKHPEYKISKNHLYMNTKRDLPKIKNKNQIQYILENTIAKIYEIENANDDMIIQKYKTEKIKNIQMYHVMAIKNEFKVGVGKEINGINSIKICDINSAIEYTENLFIIREKDKISKIRYNIAVMTVNIMKRLEKDKFKKNEKLNDKYIKELNLIYQYKFNNRINEKLEIIPKEKFLFELYKKSYLHTSAYQSILEMFNYITVMGKFIEYYLYVKNNPGFKSDDIYSSIIGDNPTIWNYQIIVNVCKKNQDVLYKNIREKKIKLSDDEKILLQTYLSYLLNINIEGEEITFDGIANTFIQFRNKVEAHGIISDENVYANWNLTRFFVNIYSKIFEILEFECIYDVDKNEVKVGYKNEEKVNLSKYVIMRYNGIYFIKDVEKELDKQLNKTRLKYMSYINYLTGETEIIEKV